MSGASSAILCSLNLPQLWRFSDVDHEDALGVANYRPCMANSPAGTKLGEASLAHRLPPQRRHKAGSALAPSKLPLVYGYFPPAEPAMQSA